MAAILVYCLRQKQIDKIEYKNKTNVFDLAYIFNKIAFFEHSLFWKIAYFEKGKNLIGPKNQTLDRSQITNWQEAVPKPGTSAEKALFQQIQYWKV